MKDINFKEIEKKVKSIWEKVKIYKTDIFTKKNKKYVLDMFPYPSGSWLHVGHRRWYVLSDLIAKIYKMDWNEVLHPMWFDSFWLPAENYAIQTWIHPLKTTIKAIQNFRKQLNETASWYDWDLEVITCKPDYYKRNQWIFLQFFKNWWAYKGKAPVNWCPSCQTVLANEQVIEWKCDRCKTPVEKKFLNQWFFKITDFAESLYNDIDKKLPNWPERVKIMQKNWIGKSDWSQFKMILESQNHQDITDFEVFTTRLDTVFGMSYVVFSPEKVLELIEEGKLNSTNLKNFNEVYQYCQNAINQKEIDRTAENKEKTWIQLQWLQTTNPFNGEQIPVWVADYVIGGYWTWVVMAVPAHDSRDWQFAKKFNLPIKRVIYPAKFVASVLDPQVLINPTEAFNQADENEIFYKEKNWLLYIRFDPEKENYFQYWVKNFAPQDIETAIYEFDFNIKQYVLQTINSNLYNEFLSDPDNFDFQENTAFTKKWIIVIK